MYLCDDSRADVSAELVRDQMRSFAHAGVTVQCHRLRVRSSASVRAAVRGVSVLLRAMATKFRFSASVARSHLEF